MKKGSLVMVKNKLEVQMYIFLCRMSGMIMPEEGVVYTLSADIVVGTCKGCGKQHPLAIVEEMAGETFSPWIFEEIQPSEEVNISSILEESVKEAEYEVT